MMPANAIMPIDRRSSVDCGSSDSLGRGQSHVAAGESEHELHTLAPGGSRIEIGRYGKDGASFQQRCSRGVAFFRQAEGSA